MTEKRTTDSAVFVMCAKCRNTQRIEFAVTSETVKQEKASVPARNSANDVTLDAEKLKEAAKKAADKKEKPVKDVKE